MKPELREWRALVRQRAGFTLLEMMVVMALLGLLTTLVLPSMQRWHDAVQTRSRVAAVVEALQAAAFAAPASRKRLVMQQGSFAAAAEIEAAMAASGLASGPTALAPALPTAPATVEADSTSTLPSDATLLRVELPAGWRAERVRDAEFLPNGLCRAGFASLRTERGSTVVVVVDGPLCAVRTSDTEPAT